MDPSARDRRQGDRRRTDRRRAGDVASPGGDPARGGDSFFDPGWLAAGDAAADSRFGGRAAAGGAALPPEAALSRVFRTYAAARAVVGVGLVLAQGAATVLGGRGSELIALVCTLYAVQAITLWLLPRFGTLADPRPGQRLQWLSTIVVDLCAFATLHLFELGSSFNYAALLVLPVLMAGVLTPRLPALATASAVALLLLAAAWRASDGAPGPMLQSGLAGLGLFVIALLAGELAGRLVREEQAARGSRELARQQAQLNRLVIEEMVDGVLVVDRLRQVRAANPAARALLVAEGLAPLAPFGLTDRATWAPLHEAVGEALALGRWPEAGRDVTLAFGEGHTRTLRLRVRFMRRPPASGPAEATDAPAGAEPAGGGGEQFAVLLLEDVRTALARVRQEKLAAMGRVSAGIAHEIRNPLAAISQANALLLEDDLPPAQRRLARMVADNVERLKRLVDDVMEVAPGAQPVEQLIDAGAVVAATTADWARTVGLGLGGDSRLRVELPAVSAGTLVVVFDPEHLRRVLVNLLDNAHRHASGAAGAIGLRLAVLDDGLLQLSVRSDGPPIAPEVERHLFEPFSSTRSRGSGLGLYICRELCARYGASIEYRARPAAEPLRNEFCVNLRRAAAGHTGGAGALPLPLDA